MYFQATSPEMFIRKRKLSKFVNMKAVQDKVDEARFISKNIMESCTINH